MIQAELASNIALAQQEILSHQQEIPLFESENVVMSQEDIARSLAAHPCDKKCPKGYLLNHKDCTCDRFKPWGEGQTKVVEEKPIVEEKATYGKSPVKEPIVEKPIETKPKDFQGRFGQAMTESGCGYQWTEIEVESL